MISQIIHLIHCKISCPELTSKWGSRPIVAVLIKKLWPCFRYLLFLDHNFSMYRAWTARELHGCIFNSFVPSLCDFGNLVRNLVKSLAKILQGKTRSWQENQEKNRVKWFWLKLGSTREDPVSPNWDLSFFWESLLWLKRSFSCFGSINFYNLAKIPDAGVKFPCVGP